MPILGRGGCFIRSPYAELAHFLVVQKMLARFDTIYTYMDAAREMSTGSLVAFRDRILAGRPDAENLADGRKRRQRAEIVLFQHDKSARKDAVRQPYRSKRDPKRDEELLRNAWKRAEKRYRKQEVPKILRRKKDLVTRKKLGKNHPSVRAHLFRHAVKGARDKGGWAWLHYPPSSIAYRRPRSLWLTRMPGKTYKSHGREALAGATLQPVDSIFNSVRARTASAGRPLLRAKGRGYRRSYFLPSVVLNELSVYLIGRNYMLRRKTAQKTIPAVAMGLAKSTAADKQREGPRAAERHRAGSRTDEKQRAGPQAAERHETRLDLAKVACDFRLGISHARRISGWRRR